MKLACAHFGACQCADIANAIFTTAPAVALIITLVLDNTIPGTIRERGLHVWLRVKGAAENWWDDDSLHDVSPLALPPSGVKVLTSRRGTAC